jgi:hypothetical protein
MCPMCIGAATWYFAGASSVSGIVALVLKRSGVHNNNKHNDVCDDSESKRALKGFSSGSKVNGTSSDRVCLSE